MKGEKKSPTGRLTQSKITAFWQAADNNRKRKNAVEIAEVHKTPVKRPANSPDMFQASKHTDFDDFELGDFENDPFLSPRKKESPKKNILAENFSANEEAWMGEKSEISFETSVKCKVTKAAFARNGHYEQVLQVADLNSGRRGVCRLRDVWASFAFSPDDVVSVQAGLTGGLWIVDNKTGHVVLDPDIPVSTTTLTNSIFCMRKGVLSNYYKEIDSEGSNRMLIGRLIHELFQEGLKRTSGSNEELVKILSQLMQSRDNLHNFYFSNMNVADIQKEMKSFIPRVRNFLETYVKQQTAPANFDGTIDDIVDIEELIKSPTLGLQGRIDVTVKLRSKNGEKIAPLELKTGRASFSSEHRAQLVAYILLMNELGRKVESGLLLYLREDAMEEIQPQRDEIRNLFLLRNHFVDLYKRFATGVLPDPIRNTKSCGRCSQFRICTTYLTGEKSENRVGIAEDVRPTHVDYFLKWNKMLCLEFQEMGDEIEMTGLTLDPNAKELEEEFKCSFRKRKETEAVRPGTFVHVLDEKGNRVCTGRVNELTDAVISVLTDRKPTDFAAVYKLVVFKSNFLTFYLSNLGWLLNEEFERLRELIVDKRAPVFEKNFDKTEFEKCLKLLLDLNKQQQKAVLKAILCQDYLLIKGPPGTGKTQTILALVKVLLALNKTVLIAGHTHSSIDNILLRLDGVEYLRLGSLKNIRKEIHDSAYNRLLENCSSVDDVRKLFERKVIASTCIGLDADFVRKIKVDYCIVDESSQVLQPEVLRALFCCRKFVLVGDEDQLPPIVRNHEARAMGMDESMFEWLMQEQAVVRLNLQYRMNAAINSLANAITYGGLLECGSEGVANAVMQIPNREVYRQQDEWITEILSPEPIKSVVFVDTSEYFQSGGEKPHEERSSTLEANIIARLINCLIKFGLKQTSVGVITPFWDQISLLKRKLTENDLQEIELNTVEQYQGRDKEVILFSCTKENQAGREAVESELLNEKRRLTVALTRAKHKLIITGDRQTVARYKPFRKLLESLHESQVFRLVNGEKNFFWENFVT